MRLVIDLQAAQSPGSRHRGIGRYSLALARAMILSRGSHEVIVALSGMFPETIPALREALGDVLPQSAIRVWHATLPPSALNCVAAGSGNDVVRAAELVREAFMASLEPDFVHIASLFESSQFALSSIASGRFRVPTAVTLYDLIPYIYPQVYQSTPEAAAHYQNKIAHLRRADLCLAISESSRQEGIAELGLAPTHVVNISSAADAHFTPAPVPPEREAEMRLRFGLERPFVMYTGGIDHRKNVDGLIRAWGELPTDVRAGHQLAVVCAIQHDARAKLEQVMRESGLAPGEVVLSGFVSEQDLLDLYRLCKLFVFPSNHEGFGLPALEAMSCGAPVIGASNSSIPEVIGRGDALFESRSTGSIARKILQALQDDAFRTSLTAHGLERARLFSWEASARAAWSALELAHRALQTEALDLRLPADAARKRLALVSPLPPERSGIADATADVLPELLKYYDIELVASQTETRLPAGLPDLPLRTPEWFLANGASYDRVLYQFGNSAFHEFMFPLLERHPGTVVLHDFFLSGLVSHRQGTQPHFWDRALYQSHGWRAVLERFASQDAAPAVYKYPANFGVLARARGVIVHSGFALRLGKEWFGPDAVRHWNCVPLLRVPAAPGMREAARKRLGIAADEFIVCSFGHLGPIKLNHRLLRGWRASQLHGQASARLVFVGDRSDSDYGRAFEAELASDPANVHVTGWLDDAGYADWLDAADVAVQLRGMSRGETSAAVLDCMNHGVATIANREGAMADLDTEAVWLLPEGFADADLSDALERLWLDRDRREAMGRRGRDLVRTLHAPRACANGYAEAIESDASRAVRGTPGLLAELGSAIGRRAPDSQLNAFARAIAHDLPAPRGGRQLLLDIGASVGIPSAVMDLLKSAPLPWRLEPVRQRADGQWVYAREAMLEACGGPAGWLQDDLVAVHPQDAWARFDDASQVHPAAVELGLPVLLLPVDPDSALTWAVIPAVSPAAGGPVWFMDVSELVQRDAQSGIQRVVKNHLMELLLHPPAGITVTPVYATDHRLGYRLATDFTLGLAGIRAAVADDTLIDPRKGDVFFGLDLQPHIVPLQATTLAAMRERGARVGFMVYDLLPLQLPGCFAPGAAADHVSWLDVVAQGDFAVCISRAVADDLSAWIRTHHPQCDGRISISAVHLGGDLAHTLPSTGRPANAHDQLAAIRTRPTFLMVGTLEPRKCHAQVLAAFERLWATGHELGLVIYGRRGWMVDDLAATLESHPELGKRLHWIREGSDEYLDEIYASCVALIAASRGEGFGLPLVEAARHGLPIIARDIPVFREVARAHAWWFHDEAPEALAASLLQWLALWRQGRHPASQGLPWITWAQSAQALARTLRAQVPESV